MNVHFEPRHQALALIRRTQQADKRQVVEQLIETRQRNRDVMRLRRILASGYRRHHCGDRIRLNDVQMHNRGWVLVRIRRDTRAEHPRALLRRARGDPHPQSLVLLERSPRPRPIGPGRRSNANVLRAANHGLKRRLVKPPFDRAHVHARSFRRLGLRAAKGG
jgi:hypothetical protein